MIHARKESKVGRLAGNPTQCKQFVPKYLVDLSGGLFGFLPPGPSLFCKFRGVPLQAFPLQRSILKGRCADGQYIYTGDSPPLPLTHIP
jgi:hypothetical protein